MADASVGTLCSDGDIAVVFKPAGIESQASAKGADMVSALSEMLGGEIYAVHRLDRETCGVMVYARTAEAAAKLSEQMRRDLVTKFYLAVLLGSPEAESGVYEDLLYHDTKRNKSYVVSCARRGVREARLAYRTVGRRGILTLAAIRLYTGRTHQIRVQFASRGTPVYGDRRYGGRPDRDRWGADAGSIRGIALCCAAIEFTHPSTGEPMRFECAPEGAAWDGFDIPAALAVCKKECLPG